MDGDREASSDPIPAVVTEGDGSRGTESATASPKMHGSQHHGKLDYYTKASMFLPNASCCKGNQGNLVSGKSVVSPPSSQDEKYLTEAEYQQEKLRRHFNWKWKMEFTGIDIALDDLNIPDSDIALKITHSTADQAGWASGKKMLITANTCAYLCRISEICAGGFVKMQGMWKCGLDKVTKHPEWFLQTPDNIRLLCTMLVDLGRTSLRMYPVYELINEFVVMTDLSLDASEKGLYTTALLQKERIDRQSNFLFDEMDACLHELEYIQSRLLPIRDQSKGSVSGPDTTASSSDGTDMSKAEEASNVTGGFVGRLLCLSMENRAQSLGRLKQLRPTTHTMDTAQITAGPADNSGSWEALDVDDVQCLNHYSVELAEMTDSSLYQQKRTEYVLAIFSSSYSAIERVLAFATSPEGQDLGKTVVEALRVWCDPR
jgi:hypothetical protein